MQHVAGVCEQCVDGHRPALEGGGCDVQPFDALQIGHDALSGAVDEIRPLIGEHRHRPGK
ncbi:hypothetical protein D3C87_2147710 [compost metagenome]